MAYPERKVGGCVAYVCPDDPTMEIREGQSGRIEWFEPDPPADTIDRASPR